MGANRKQVASKMIIYDLRCHQSHQFEGWFRSADDYQAQLRAGLLSCPVCDSKEVVKIPSASYVHSGKGAQSRRQETEQQLPATASVSPSPQTLLAQTLANLQEYIRHHSEDVGKEFAEEAKKIHYGEAENRSIHGQASVEQLQELHEEGIEVLALPVIPSGKSKLN